MNSVKTIPSSPLKSFNADGDGITHHLGGLGVVVTGFGSTSWVRLAEV